MLHAKPDPGREPPATGQSHESRHAVTAALEPCRLRVLIVDDEPGDIALIDRALRRMVRYEVEVASVGSLEAALWALSAEPQDLILVDYSLGADCGTTLVREMTARGRSTPVIVLTSLWTADIEAEVLDAGGIACLLKDDLTPRIMETTVRQSLRGQALERTLHDLTAAPAHASGETSQSSLCSVEAGTRFDIQCLAIDAVSTWHRLHKSAPVSRIPMRLHLMDRPLYVRASEIEIRSAFDWVFHALPVNATRGTTIDLSVIESKGRGEVVVEASALPAERTLIGRRGFGSGAEASDPVLRSEVSIGSGGGQVVEYVSRAMASARRSLCHWPGARIGELTRLSGTITSGSRSRVHPDVTRPSRV